jgi:site-specific DNA-cytosine methylase
VLPAALETALESLAHSQDDSAKESTAPLTSLSSLPTQSAPALPSEEKEEMVAMTSSSVRRLTPTECERLMGWPDGWTISKKWKPSRLSRDTLETQTVNQEESQHE